MVTRRTLQSSSNASTTSRLATYWSDHPRRFSFPFNSQKFFQDWKSSKGELNVPAFLKAFDFGFLEFGRYVRQNEREARFAGLAEGCLVLSSNLFFDSSNLGCDRHINVAIGARGLGGPALAHFEPRTMSINVTKEGGNHSFAHEYAHALDYFLGMTYDQSTKYSYLSGGHSSVLNLDANVGGKLRAVTVAIVQEAARQFEAAIGKEAFLHLVKMCSYWYRPTEIFARCFESWIAYVFAKVDNGKGYNLRNSFLVKPLSAYSRASIYPHKWDKLDNLFMVWCLLVGEAMKDKSLGNLPSVETALKAAQSRRSKFGIKTQKPTQSLLTVAKSKKSSSRQTKMEFDRKPPKKLLSKTHK